MKYYVVWEGRKPGIYTTWEECKEQVHKFKQAKYKSFKTKELAEEAFSTRAEEFKKAVTPNRKREPLPRVNFPKLGH